VLDDLVAAAEAELGDIGSFTSIDMQLTSL